MTHRKGFSLLEATVVLGVVGAVVAGLWVVIGTVGSNMKITRTQQQIQIIMENVRDYYGGRALPSGAIVAATYTATMRAARIFPDDLCNATCAAGSSTIYNAFNGATTIAVPNVTGYNEVELAFNNVSKKGCYDLASWIGAYAGTNGVTYFKAGDAAARTSFPIDPTALSSDCDENLLDLTFRFKIRL